MLSRETVRQSLFGPGKGKIGSGRGSYRDLLKWPAFVVSFVCFSAGRFKSFLHLVNDAGDIPSNSSAGIAGTISGTILAITLVLALVLGLLTVPRWQGFLSLAVVAWVIWMRLAL